MYGEILVRGGKAGIYLGQEGFLRLHDEFASSLEFNEPELDSSTKKWMIDFSKSTSKRKSKSTHSIINFINYLNPGLVQFPKPYLKPFEKLL